MITRAHRFHGHYGLPALYKRSKTVRGTQMSLKYAQRPINKPYRVAVVVSRKVNKSAVVRNRIRRRLYETMRLYQDQLNNSYDLAIIVYNDQLASQPYSQLQKELIDLLTKAKLLKPSNDRGIVEVIGK